VRSQEGKWHVRYINRDPAVEERKKALERKEKMDADDSERAAKMVEKQIKEVCCVCWEGGGVVVVCVGRGGGVVVCLHV